MTGHAYRPGPPTGSAAAPLPSSVSILLGCSGCGRLWAWPGTDHRRRDGVLNEAKWHCPKCTHNDGDPAGPVDTPDGGQVLQAPCPVQRPSGEVPGPAAQFDGDVA